jgi:hypothetical protein
VLVATSGGLMKERFGNIEDGSVADPKRKVAVESGKFSRQCRWAAEGKALVDSVDGSTKIK